MKSESATWQVIELEVTLHGGGARIALAALGAWVLSAWGVYSKAATAEAPGVGACRVWAAAPKRQLSRSLMPRQPPTRRRLPLHLLRLHCLHWTTRSGLRDTFGEQYYLFVACICVSFA